MNLFFFVYNSGNIFNYSMTQTNSSSLSETLLKKWFWLYAFWYVIAPAWYIIKILVSWHISVSELGVLYGVISLVTLLSAFSDIGMSEMIKYYIPKFLEEKKYNEIKSIIVYSFLTQIITGLILASLFFWWSDIIAAHYFKTEAASQILKIFSLFFLWINTFQIITNYFLATQNTFWYKFLEFLRTAWILIAVFIFTLRDIHSLEIYSSAWIIGLYIGIIFWIVAFLRKWYSKNLKDAQIVWSISLAQTIFSYSILTFLSAQAWVILSQIDMQMIIFMLGTQDAGYYSVYLSLIMIPFLILWPIFPLLIPLCADLYSKKEFSKLGYLKTFFTKYFSLIWLISWVFLFVFSDYFSYWLFGKDFIPSGTILRYSSIFLVFNFLLQINFALLSGIGKVAIRLKIILFAIIVNTILNFVFISQIGVSGAALATGVGWFIIYAISEWSLVKTISSKLDRVFLWKNIFILFILSIGSSLIISKLPFDEISRIYIIFFITFFAVFWGVIFLITNIKETNIFIGEIKKLIK